MMATDLEKRKVLIVETMDGTQFRILEGLIREEIHRVFSKWAEGQDKLINDGLKKAVEDARKKMNEDAKSIGIRQAEYRKHANQVETYLSGFNKILNKLAKKK